ncbi:MAG: lipoyl(octanoyl) transferase LipB [Candidatus Bathyarchaeia archaeon]|jgi:lipoate-protein ligase B
MSKTLVIDLQTRDYKETWELQLSLVELRAQALVPDVLLLVEHPHVVTMGTSGKPENILSKRFPIFKVERGGDVTYHGYGQLVGYPIIDLTPRDKKVGRYVRDLEAMLIETLDHFGISAQRIEGRTGVWIGEQKKIASIGVAVRSWITFHGFALNVSTDLSCFSTINPCGYESGVMTSITEQLERPVSISEVKGPIRNAFEHVFGTKLEPASEEKLTRSVRSGVPAKT